MCLFYLHFLARGMTVLFQLSQNMLVFWQLEVKCLEEAAPCSNCCECNIQVSGGPGVGGWDRGVTRMSLAG